jgi:hypothetical protein
MRETQSMNMVARASLCLSVSLSRPKIPSQSGRGRLGISVNCHLCPWGSTCGWQLEILVKTLKSSENVLQS